MVALGAGVSLFWAHHRNLAAAFIWILMVLWFFTGVTVHLRAQVVDLPELFKTQRTVGRLMLIAPLINIPKGFSCKMTVEVAKIGLKVITQYML